MNNNHTPNTASKPPSIPPISSSYKPSNLPPKAISTPLPPSSTPPKHQPNTTTVTNELQASPVAMTSIPQTPPPTISTPKELADRYRFIKKIGQGAQGTVFLAQRIKDNLQVAIKHLNIDSVQNWKEYDLFHREAEVLQSLNMKGVATFYEAPEYLDIPEPSAYIVQEYINGQSIQKMLDSGYRFTLNRVLQFVLKILDILNDLHTHNPPIIHRDLKPANILMKLLPNGDFEPYLIDFGAVANPQVQTGGSTVAGTYGYMPPEQLMGRPVPASDIYSLAAMITYMLCGTQPSEMQITDFHLIIDPYMENIPNGVTATLHQMLEPKIENRLTDYHTLHERFEMLLSGKLDMSYGSAGSLDDSKLLKVHMLGQRGNIDLWMALADSVPRTLPKPYQNLTHAIPVDSMSVLPKYRKQVWINNFWKLIPIFIGIEAIVIVIAYLFSLIPSNDLSWQIKNDIYQSFCNDSWNEEHGVISETGPTWGTARCILEYFLLNTGFARATIISLFIFLFAIGSTFSMTKNIANEYRPKPKEERKWSYNVIEEEEKLSYINKLLAEGKKTLAIVTSIEFKQTESNRFEVYPQTENNKCFNAYIHTYPSFRIKYKFNPPDDDNPKDLVHEISVHRDMSDVLHVGDALPILYYINPNNNLDVISMPFPYPLDDVGSFCDLCYKKNYERYKV